jgi:hypothetical protein
MFLGCGYRVAGLDTKVNYKFFLDRIVSLDKESDYNSLLDNEAKGFLNSYNALNKDSKDYDFKLTIILKNVNTDSSIISKSSQTVQTDLLARVNILVNDQNGKKIFEKEYLSTQSYNITNNISQNIENRNTAFKIVVRNILLDFFYDFQNKK